MKRDKAVDAMMNQRLHDIVNAIHNFDTLDVLQKLFESSYGVNLSQGNLKEVISSYHEAYRFVNHFCGGFKQRKNEEDIIVLNWMCDVYWTMFVEFGLDSKEACRLVKPDRLYKLYNPLHETSEINCVRKILDTYQEVL